jgi:hypothetical protein
VLDRVDLMTSKMQEDLRDMWLPNIQENTHIKNNIIRFIIISERRIGSLVGWGYDNQVSFKQHHVKCLAKMTDAIYSPFLLQAVRKYGGENLQKSDYKYLRQWAKDLYEITKGHPLFIERILENLGRTKYPKISENLFIEQRKFLCREVLSPAIDQYFEDKTREILHLRLRDHDHFSTLQQIWIFRYMSKAIFQELLLGIQNKPYWGKMLELTKEEDLLPENTPKLLKELQNTPLLYIGGPFSHSFTAPWRKAWSLTLYNINPELYRELHKDAGVVFSSYAFAPETDNIVEYFSEYLYHTTQEYKGRTGDSGYKKILKQTSIFLKLIKDKNTSEHLYKLEKILEVDDELRKEMIACVNETTNSNTYIEVVNAVSAFFDKEM